MAMPELIHKLRTGAKLSQEQFAALFHVSRQSVQKWESGLVTPELSKVIEISKYFGVSLDALILEAVRETAAHAAKCPLAYTRRILDQAAASGQLTLAAWQAGRRASGSGKRVDRPQPSGNDFLADAAIRPRRHKRKE